LTELTLARVWQEGLLAREMRTVDGRRLRVIYRGVWTYADGPDFRDAMIDLDGELRRGAVELHLRASDWERHRHQSDPAYDAVVLHAVLDDDLAAPVAAPAGRPIPTVRLRDYLAKPLDGLLSGTAAVALGPVGGLPCLPTLAGGREDLVRGVLRREGWRRLADKRLAVLQALEQAPPGDVLKRLFLDALGLTRNRDGMAAVADRAPLAALESAAATGPAEVRGMLLSVASLLPIAPAHAQLAEMSPDEVVATERAGDALARAWRLGRVEDGVWVLNRVRPANHPVRRLLAFADILCVASRDGLLGTVLAIPVDRPDAWRRWLLAASPRLGRSRADQIVVNVLAPFVVAWAEAAGDDELAERVGELWERIPGAVDDAVARATLAQICGDTQIPIRLAIEVQGLHRIGREGCRELRCFDCPIAMLAATHEPERRGPGLPDRRGHDAGRP